MVCRKRPGRLDGIHPPTPHEFDAEQLHLSVCLRSCFPSIRMHGTAIEEFINFAGGIALITSASLRR